MRSVEQAGGSNQEKVGEQRDLLSSFQLNKASEEVVRGREEGGAHVSLLSLDLPLSLMFCFEPSAFSKLAVLSDPGRLS